MPEDEEQELLDTPSTEDNNDEVLDEEEKTWKKRYGDLRKYSQKQTSDLKEEISELSKKIAALSEKQIELPKTEEEVEEWARMYPDVAKIVQTIAMKEVNKQREEVKQLRAELQNKENSNKEESAAIILERLHPDFFTVIRDSDEFKEWLSGKSKRSQDALYKDLDPYAAAEVVTLYKAENNIKSEKPPKNYDAKGAALDTGSRGSGPNPRGSKGQYKFSESQIKAMGHDEYEANADEIDKAQRAGQILYDISGASR